LNTELHRRRGTKRRAHGRLNHQPAVDHTHTADEPELTRRRQIQQHRAGRPAIAAEIRRLFNARSSCCPAARHRTRSTSDIDAGAALVVPAPPSPGRVRLRHYQRRLEGRVSSPSCASPAGETGQGVDQAGDPAGDVEGEYACQHGHGQPHHREDTAQREAG